MPTGAMIAAIETHSSTHAQKLLAERVEHWQAEGVRVAGFIEVPHNLADRNCKGGILRDVATGALYPIYQEEIPPGAICHVDARGAYVASHALLSQIESCDVVVISKFGKLEAAQAGLVPVFEAARAAGKPVLTAVSDKHREAWAAFAPGAEALAADSASLSNWFARAKA